MSNNCVDDVIRNILYMNFKVSEFQRAELKKFVPHKFHSQIDTVIETDLF